MVRERPDPHSYAKAKKIKLLIRHTEEGSYLLKGQAQAQIFSDVKGVISEILLTNEHSVSTLDAYYDR